MHDEHRHHPRRHGDPKSFLKGAFFGAAIGAVLGVLFAPDSGDNTRKKIKQKSEELVEKGVEKAELVAEKIEEVKDKVEPYKERAEEIIENAKEIATEETDNIKKRYFKGTRS